VEVRVLFGASREGPALRGFCLLGLAVEAEITDATFVAQFKRA
jgi:hypothetical protein